MNRRPTIWNIFILVLGSLLLLAAVCFAEPQPGETTLATGSEVESLPKSGKVISETQPPKAVFGMIWIDATTNIEYIFDGNGWVRHDQAVDDSDVAQ